jgi:hypothetical protein
MLNNYPTIEFSISDSNQKNDYIFEVRYILMFFIIIKNQD